MKKVVSLLTLLTLTAGFSQGLSFDYGTPFRCPNLEVRWNTNFPPRKVWVYRTQRTDFSPRVISNLMVFCSFSANDKSKEDKDGITFQNGSRRLSISFLQGSIDYEKPLPQYGINHLAEGVPQMVEIPELTLNFLTNAGIAPEEIKQGSHGPEFNLSEPFTMFVKSNLVVTNIESRSVWFRRAVDGIAFVGYDRGGNGGLRFGEQGKPCKIDLSWRKLERVAQYSTVTAEQVIKWIRSGKAIQGPVSIDVGEIDWNKAKSLTVTKAEISYLGRRYSPPGSLVEPYVGLMTTVDTGHGNVDVEIDCPVIDESQPLPIN
jgi:hypothetical protein